MLSRKWVPVVAIIAGTMLSSAVFSATSTTQPPKAQDKQPAKASQSIQDEINMGKEGAKSAEKDLKFITTPEYAKRVEAIGQKLAAVAKITKVPAVYGTPDLADFTYSFRVVDDKEINAFSLPAGYVYVNKGLIDQAESDDELAAVIAHEIAHISHHHMLKLYKKQTSLNNVVMLVLAGAIIGQVQGADMQNIFYGAQLLEVAKLNGYSMKAENDADTTAITYMMKANYNAVGMLTFMEKLAHDESLDPFAQEVTVFSNHPPSKDRVKSIMAELQKNNIPIDRTAVTTAIRATVKETTVNNQKLSDVVIGNALVLRVADNAKTTSAERAKAIAEAINKQLDKTPQPYEIKVGGDGAAVYMKQEPVVQVMEEDAVLAGKSREELATKAKTAIQGSIAKDIWRKAY